MFFLTCWSTNTFLQEDLLFVYDFVLCLSMREQVALHQDLCKNTLSASILELVARSDRKRNRKNANFVISYLSLSMYKYNLSLCVQIQLVFVCANIPCLCVCKYTLSASIPELFARSGRKRKGRKSARVARESARAMARNELRRKLKVLLSKICIDIKPKIC